MRQDKAIYGKWVSSLRGVTMAKKSISKELQKVLDRTGYNRLVEKHGTKLQRRRKMSPPTALCAQTSVKTALSNKIDANGLKFDTMAHRWKKGCIETPETVRKIERKAKATAPLYNKGGYQYISPETDVKSIGRK